MKENNMNNQNEKAAEFKLKLNETEAEHTSKEDVFAKLLARGVHPEIVFRLERVWHYTRRVGKRMVHIGRLAVVKILEFIEAHPQMCIGALLGAAVGALMNGIPVLGHILAPVSVAIGAIFGAVVGHDLDREDAGLPNRHGNSLRQTIEALVEIAKEFFRLFIQMVNLVFGKGRTA